MLESSLFQYFKSSLIALLQREPRNCGIGRRLSRNTHVFDVFTKQLVLLVCTVVK